VLLRNRIKKTTKDRERKRQVMGVFFCVKISTFLRCNAMQSSLGIGEEKEKTKLPFIFLFHE
jgi:hypothetical protein